MDWNDILLLRIFLVIMLPFFLWIYSNPLRSSHLLSTVQDPNRSSRKNNNALAFRSLWLLCWHTYGLSPLLAAQISRRLLT